jgi:hypothetical protein
MLRTCLLLLCIFGAAAAPAAQTPFDGKWTAEVIRPAPAGNQHITLDLKTSEGKVTGTLTVQGAAPSPITWGMIKGNLITFRVEHAGAATPIKFNYLGEIQGDRIMFGRRPEDLSTGRLVELTAVRSK